jgi:hypothetical protein
MNCIYCQAEMLLWDDDDGDPESHLPAYGKEGRLIYQCKPCQSQQDCGMVTGQLIDYGFRVGKYGLWFFPYYGIFKIKDYSDEVYGEETVLELNIIPTNLTPQNTTEERIKTLILFS